MMATNLLLIDVAWLMAHLKDVCLVDARPPLRYAQGRLPTAVNFPPLAMTHMRQDKVRVLAEPSQLEKLIQSAGIDEESHVVIYGERGGQDAAFLWWALGQAGISRLSLLNGGIEAWIRAGQSLTLEVPNRNSSQFKVKFNPSYHVSGEWILSHLSDSSIQIVDTRSLSEFTGEEILTQRGGHIPGAIHFEWLQVLNPDLTFKSPQEIKTMLIQVGLHPEGTTINYCQSGARSAHATFAMRLAGWKDARNYQGSWAEWGNHEKFPVERESPAVQKESLHNEPISEKLDLRGELCPYTLIDTKKRMEALEAGAMLEVLIDNEDATQTIPAWAKQVGHRILKLERVEQGWRLVLKKDRQQSKSQTQEK
jgi:thiosulfate/3-mercaptopyruvate sulfurtransferase